MIKKSWYNFELTHCDILDKNKCEDFRKKREQWIDQLKGEDPHAIVTQIREMLWNYALFITVNELKKIYEDKPFKSVGYNSSVSSLFNIGFVTTQALAIRRLIEKPKSDPDWAIISLRSLLKDLKANLHIITRENYVCYDGLPYNYEVVRNRLDSIVFEKEVNKNGGTIPTRGPNAWFMSELVHKNFDKLSGVKSHQRKRTDIINIDLFNVLESQISKCEDIKKYVDKYIAHAAAPETRASLNENQKKITLDQLEKYHKIIYKVANFISASLLWDSDLGGLPTPLFDHLKNLEKAWTTPGSLKMARQVWNQYSKDVSSWGSIKI